MKVARLALSPGRLKSAKINGSPLGASDQPGGRLCVFAYAVLAGTLADWLGEHEKLSQLILYLAGSVFVNSHKMSFNRYIS